jgi:hypothetical protein
MTKIFFSYCHKDEAIRDELEKHLSLLRRQGLIESWHDRRIVPGSEIDHHIDVNLEDSDIILLLISPDFIASDYCYDIEMQRAIEKHQNNEAVVIPIILEFCDWHAAPFGKHKALPEDGRPVVSYPNINIPLTVITKEIRKIVSAKKKETVNKIIPKDNLIIAPKSHSIRSSNLRIKKTFTDLEKDEFIENAFDYVAKFFENSLEELKKRNNQLETRFKKVNSQQFKCFIYFNGQEKSQCKVWEGDNLGRSHSLLFSYNADSELNSFNESINIEDDGYNMFFKSMGMQSFGQRDMKLSNEGVAEYLWNLIVKNLQ